MSEVIIRNKEFLNKLDGFIEEFLAVPNYDKPEYLSLSAPEHRNNGKYLCSEDWLDTKKNQTPLVGAPEEYCAQPIGHMKRVDPFWTDYMNRVKYDFAMEIGAHTSALLSYYPPGGFVSWHTNWDAAAYQVLFTWSKDGDGFFRYLDNETGEIVTIPDVPGWQCRWFYFGPKEEPENLCWHSAYCGSERMTLAYKFVNQGKDSPHNDNAEYLRDLLIEEIETP